MKKNQRWLTIGLWIACQFLAISLLLPMPVSADDCLTDPLNAADCMPPRLPPRHLHHHQRGREPWQPPGQRAHRHGSGNRRSGHRSRDRRSNGRSVARKWPHQRALPYPRDAHIPVPWLNAVPGIIPTPSSTAERVRHAVREMVCPILGQHRHAQSLLRGRVYSYTSLGPDIELALSYNAAPGQRRNVSPRLAFLLRFTAPAATERIVIWKGSGSRYHASQNAPPAAHSPQMPLQMLVLVEVTGNGCSTTGLSSCCSRRTLI
jgi:hypothetical protein